MDSKDFKNLGEQIKDSVQSAIDSGDFKELNKVISATVNSALDEARKQLVKEVGGKVWPEGAGSEGGRVGSSRGTSSYIDNYPILAIKRVRINHPGKVAGILSIVFGCFGLGITVPSLLAVWIIALLTEPGANLVFGLLAILLALLCGSLCLLHKGITLGNRVRRARNYVKFCGSRMYCSIQELADSLGRSRNFLLKDLRKIIETGVLFEARIEEQQTCLMLDSETYKQYLESQEARKQREREAADKARSIPVEGDLEPMMAEGRNYLRILREANEAIPGEVISGKISRLEEVIRRIFEAVLKHPEQKGEMERFMEYYLPTTVKLITAYQDFDNAGSRGNNVSSAKEDIEKTLDTINQAFEQLLDDLYKTAALDISTDATVLQTMLKKDGWTKSDFMGGERDE